MIINHNLPAMNAHRNMGINLNQGQKAMEKLSSGLRINRAGDDAAGLAISEKMRAQVRGLDQASRNAQDGISLIQTAEGALDEVHSILQRMRELAVQSSNETNVEQDQAALNDEFQQLVKEIERIKDTTQFNTQKLLDDTVDTVQLQVGANSGELIELDLTKVDLSNIHAALAPEAEDENMDITDHANAQAAIDEIDKQLKAVSEGRSYLGAMQNRLEHTIKNLDNASENLQAAESRIRDVDMAKEMMEFTRTNILNQASQAMLAQANQQPQAVLQLLG
ncbi:flagellin [Halalkalibacterium halodurans]|uniref:flagellin N-terminal helical domain-containing protein n=1 Tax=Halalkalibacterium halodurans TaxID=86665 RepID=UPI002E20C622|nr:flagellin [Halalkalibacterium halodurans]MED4161973.1 flagellin [Halalkalibacterium halodurans]